MEIEEENKIIKYLNNKNNFKIQIDNFKKYFLKKREELENILINKCNDMEITDINEQFRNIKNRVIDE